MKKLTFLLVFISIFGYAQTPITDANIQTAVDLWVSDPSAATTTYGNISDWDVSNVTDMSELFKNKTTFNDDISNWDVSSVNNMGDIFYGATAFNQPIGSWDVSSVTDMRGMFANAHRFNQDIGNWNVSNVIIMYNMFSLTQDFNKDIGNWNVTNVTNMDYMFNETVNFNQDISNWNVSNVTSMESMFNRSQSFNQNLGNWNVINVVNMKRMFDLSINFDQDISSWDVSNVNYMSGMFGGSKFNQDISSWNTINVTTMESMFSGSSFNQNIGSWDISNVINLSYTFNGSNLSTDNYDNILIGWSLQALQSNVPFGAVGHNYCSGSDARKNLIDNFGWVITDGGLDCSDTLPVITLLGESTVTLEVGTSYTDAGATASDNYDGDITDTIVIVNNVDSAVVGTYAVTYNVSDANGNAAEEVTRTVNVVDTTVPVITLLGEATVTLEVGTSYTDAGATASDNYDGDITDTIVIVNNVDSAVVGIYAVTYNVSDANGNAAEEVTRTVNVVDTTVPVITLLGEATVTLEVGTSYTDAGATASDNYDGDITDTIVIVNNVDSAVVGTYAVTYNVSDANGNAAEEVTRTVNVVDTTVPVITLLGEATVTLEVGTSYTDAGATASDNYDGDITDTIVIVNNVDSAVVGTYAVTYNVSDANGNAAEEVTRTVIIESSLSTEDNTMNIIKVYPNPVKDKLFISGNKTPIAVAIYNVLGKEVLSVKNTNNINVKALPSGVYVIRISDGVGQTNRKFIKN